MPSDAAQEAIRRSALRVAWLLEPINLAEQDPSTGAGLDLSRHPMMASVAARFNALPPHAKVPVRWHELAAEAAQILHGRSKDIGVAAYLAVAWVQTHGILGLLDGLVLMRELTWRYWDSLYPPVRKPRSRGFVFEWLAQQTCSLLYGINVSISASEVEAAQVVLDQVDSFLRHKLGEQYLGAQVLRRPLDDARMNAEQPPTPSQLEHQRWAMAVHNPDWMEVMRPPRDVGPPAPPATAVPRVASPGTLPRSMRGAAARNEPPPVEGAPIEVLHLTVRLRQVPSSEPLRSLRKNEPYRLEIALEPAPDPLTLADGRLRTAELFSEAEPPQLCVGLDTSGALLAFPDHPGSVGPGLLSDPLPCSLSAGTRSFQFDILGTNEGAVELNVTVWLRQEVLLRADLVLPCSA